VAVTEQSSPVFPGRVVVDGVVCYTRDDDPGAWWYVPGDPVPELAGTSPSLQLFAMPDSGILQFGAEWTVRGELLARIQKTLIAAAVQTVALQPAPVTVRQVTVEIGDENHPPDVAGISTSSGFPPYRAIFRINLDAWRKNAIVAALNGRTGFVLVRYHVVAPIKASARAKLEGGIETALAALSGSAAPEEIREWVDGAVATRDLVLTEETDGPADAALKQQARELVMEKFVTLLTARLRQPPPDSGSPKMRRSAAGTSDATLSVESVVSKMVEQQFERVADVSTWFAPGTGAGHVTVLPGPVGPGPGGPGPTPPKDRVSVGLGIPTRDLPVAFIEARCGEKKVLLRAPGFESSVIEGTSCGDGVTVTTHFTTGDQPWRSTVPAADAERISATALGLTEIVVDGRERQEAGARDIRVRVQFHPSGPGPTEDRTFYLRDATWVASFFVVTRGAPLDGECKLDWKETTRDGQVRHHKYTAANQSVFVLREAEPDPGAHS
jgi:hypothetical protein